MAKTKSAGPKPKNDAYTLLLFVTLVAIGVGCLLLHLDFQEYGEAAPPATPEVKIPKLGDEKASVPTPPPVPKPEAPKPPETPADPATPPTTPAGEPPAAPPAAPPATPPANP